MECKNIGQYQFKYKIEFDKVKGDFITLHLQYSENLKELIKRAVIDETTLESRRSYDGEHIDEINRYKVKSIIYSALYGDYKWAPFMKNLIDTGKGSFKLSSIRATESAVSELKETLQKIIQILLKYNDYEATMTINITDKVEE